MTKRLITHALILCVITAFFTLPITDAFVRISNRSLMYRHNTSIPILTNKDLYFYALILGQAIQLFIFFW